MRSHSTLNWPDNRLLALVLRLTSQWDSESSTQCFDGPHMGESWWDAFTLMAHLVAGTPQVTF
jgi:hypothetical protein